MINFLIPLVSVAGDFRRFFELFLNCMPTKILVTGASGFVGKALCAELVRRHYQARAVLREVGNINGCEIALIPSITSRTDWSLAVEGVVTVIHLAARVHVMRDGAANPLAEFRKLNVDATEHLARSAAAGGVKRLVYVSSIKVNGEVTLGHLPFSEADIPAPQDPYGISKWEAEQVLSRVAHETGLEVVIARPALVYGEGVKGNFLKMLSVLEQGIPLPLASVSNRRDLIYVGNLVDALITCAIHPAAANETYLVSDGESVSTPDLLRQLAAAMVLPSRLFPLPLLFLQLAGKVTGKSAQIHRLLGSLELNTSKIRSDLNWTPPHSLQQGLIATANWYQSADC